MKWTLLALAGLLGGWAWDTVSLTPTRADFGKAVVRGVSLHQFTMVRSDTQQTTVTIEGPNASDFGVDGSTAGAPVTFSECYDPNSSVFTTCLIGVNFRPASLGVKHATLVVTDGHNHRATAALQGEGVKAECLPILVPCNWTISYMGTIRINQVDSMITDDHKMRQQTVVDVKIMGSSVHCMGQRNEIEQKSYQGSPESEMKFVGTISGPGMAAIEFQPDANGKMTYVLTYACATPYGTRESRSLRGGEAEVMRVELEPADWRDALQLGEHPATEQGMPVLEGVWSEGEWDRANQAGHFIKATWKLKKLGTP